MFIAIISGHRVTVVSGHNCQRLISLGQAHRNFNRLFKTQCLFHRILCPGIGIDNDINDTISSMRSFTHELLWCPWSILPPSTIKRKPLGAFLSLSMAALVISARLGCSEVRCSEVRWTSQSMWDIEKRPNTFPLRSHEARSSDVSM